MSETARYGRVTAKPGRGGELADVLLGAAAELGDDPGCLLYLVNRQSDNPDVIWVTELWGSAEALDESLERIRGSSSVAEAMALVDDWQMIELDQLGGKRAGAS